jgi:hypothetical protein
MGSQLDITRGREIVARWCALAERRLEYLTELFETGRWRRFYGERAFLENIREAKCAVGVWRDLLSGEASRDNRRIDMSWLDPRRAALPQGEIWCDPVPLASVAEILRDGAKQDSTTRERDSVEAGDALSVRASDEGARTLAQDLRAIAERSPLLRNEL